MITLDEVRDIAVGLPEVTTGSRWGNETWFVQGKAFAWCRPMNKADIKRFLPKDPPSGDIVAVATEDMDDKRALLGEGEKGFFDIEHFKSFPAYLIQLDACGKRRTRQALVDGWLAKAPPSLAESYLKRRGKNT